MTLKEILLEKKSQIEIIKYSLIGVCNTFISYISFILIYKVTTSPETSTVISYLFGCLSSYLLNARYNFKVKYSYKKLFNFSIVHLSMILYSVIIIKFLTNDLDINIYISQILLILTKLPFSFYLTKKTLLS